MEVLNEQSFPLIEDDIQRWLAYILKGRREDVLVNLGRADIIVKNREIDYVIEVKRAGQFLSAIGQIIGYSLRREKNEGREQIRIIALFGWKGMARERIQTCDEICNAQGIHVWWLDDDFLRFIYNLEKDQSYRGTTMLPTCAFLEQYRYKRDRDDDELARMMKKRRVKIGTHRWKNGVYRPPVDVLENSDEELAEAVGSDSGSEIEEVVCETSIDEICTDMDKNLRITFDTADIQDQGPIYCCPYW